MSKASLITSVDVRQSGGSHEYVAVFIRGQNVGTLCVGKGDGEAVRKLLMAEPVYVEMPPPHAFGENNAFRMLAAEDPGWLDPSTPPYPPAGSSVVEVREATEDEQRQALERTLASMQREARETLAGLSPGKTVEACTDDPELLAERYPGRVRSEARQGTTVPLGMQPDATTLGMARALGMTEAQVSATLERFVSYWEATGKRRVDWQRELRVWLHRVSTSPGEITRVTLQPNERIDDKVLLDREKL